jgi:proteasome lid subunit RPN8/RPN11
MLFIDKQNLNNIFRHCIEKVPNEACGILAGKDSKVKQVYHMANTDNSPISYFMDPKEQLMVMKQIRSLGLEMVGVYHSHPETKAYPSARDVELALYPEVSYVIISLREKNNPVVKSFRITDNNITEEAVVIE